MNRTLALLLAVVAAGIAATGGFAGSTERSGALHVTKNCERYDFSAGSFCTITSSNIQAIRAGNIKLTARPHRVVERAGRDHRYVPQMPDEPPLPVPDAQHHVERLKQIGFVLIEQRLADAKNPRLLGGKVDDVGR